MRKRRKLMKKPIHDSKISETLISIDKKICASNQDEKLHDEQVAVAKIKDDPHFFFRYAKKSSICRSNIGPLLEPSTNCVTDDKFLMCKLLVDQFTVYLPFLISLKLLLILNSFSLLMRNLPLNLLI